MLRHKLSLMMAATLISFNALAQLPHSFKNGEVADADEVNANFTYLENEVKKLAAKTDAWAAQNPHPYTPQPRSTNIGDEVTINGMKFVIVGMPFVDFADGSRHILKYPAASCQSGKSSQPCQSPYFTSTTVSTSHINAPMTSNFTVSGYPARFTPYESRSYRGTFYYNYTTKQTEPEFTVSESINATNIQIMVGETYLSFYSPLTAGPDDDSFSSIIHQRGPQHTADADFSDEIDWNAVRNHQLPHDTIYQFVDYVEVIDLPSP